MATLDDSPSHFAGQLWSEWAKNVPSPPYSDSGGECSESKASDDGDSMKLSIEDSALFGVCPSQDEFYLIQCERCNKVVKPQAFNKHFHQRHSQHSVSSIESKNITSNRSSKMSPAKHSSMKMGLSVPTKASMKEIPPSISNAQKMGATLNARLKSSDKKRNHTLPFVKVERMNVNKMDMKKVSSLPSQSVETVQESDLVTNGETVCAKKTRTLTPPSVKSKADTPPPKTPTPPPVHTSTHTGTTKTMPPNFKSTFTQRPLSPPKSVTHVLFLTNTTPSVSMATPTLTTATTACVTTTMTTTLLAPQVSASVALNSISLTNPCKSDIDIKNLQNLGMDGEELLDEKDLNMYRDQNLNSVKIEDKSLDEGYSSSLHSFSESCMNNNAQTNGITGHNLASLSDTNFHNISATNINTIGNRTLLTLDSSSSLKSHLLADKKAIMLTNREASLNNLTGTSMNNISSSSLNSLSVTSLNSLSNTSLNSSGSNHSIGSAGNSSKKKYPRLLFGKADKLIPCKDREYDPDKHCGVEADDGKPCTRSLTCKTHAVSRRRKVEGRRKPFDDLLKEHRAAKEILLKQKAEMKQAAALGMAKPSALQTGTPTVTDIPYKPGQVKIEKENSSHYSGHMDSHLTIFKPGKPNSIHSHRSSLSSLHSFSTPSPKDDPLKSPDFPPDEDDGQESSYLSYHPRPAAMCTFGARSHSNNGGKRCYTFNRKQDLFRVAFLSALEKHLNPPPAKKRCLESNLPKDTQVNMNSKDPYDFQTLDTSGINQVQHFNTVLNPIDSSSAKHKSRPSGGSKHKQKDSAGSKSPAHATNSAIVNAIGNSAKRRRSGGSVSTTSATLPTNLRNVSSNSTMQTVCAPTVMGNITLNSQTNTPLIAIPNVNLSSTTLSHISANLNSAKQPKNNIFKDFGLVLTGLDGSLMNGQYLNITAAPQSVDDKSIQQTHIINKNNKIVNLDQLKTITKSNLIPVTQFFVDGGVQQGTTVLAPVSLTSMSNSSVVTIASNVSQPQTNPILASHTLKPGGVSSHMTLTSIQNGVLSSTDKSNPRPQSVVHHKPKSIHPQHGILTNAVIASSNNQQVCGGQLFTTQLAQLQVKPMNIAKSGAAGELSVQPVSLTFPLAGLRVPGQQHSTQTFYITSTNDSQQHDIQQVTNSSSMS